ncbi:interleukin-13 receptor subunit alpha-1-like isoform X2 [Hypanus sabinus]|uniref:interleukin-13 receptor subunit alpha-1-like isoform X2 n=1 Tax=Hypanus sabinus TaxID=79690 RepID=UPI0028C44892|nr:interleukin-13 receptor subunit alpha-1-like isoform X2 [Hypanus sabinus]
MQDLVSLRFLLLVLPGWLALPPPSEAHPGCDNFSVSLQPPSNLTAAQRGIGLINYSWTPSHLKHTKKYFLRYESSFKYDGGEWQGTKVNPLSSREEVLLLNKGIKFRVKALVALTTEENSSPPTCQQSGWVYTYTGAVEGDSNTTVTNFNCFFYNFEYVNCTWTSGSMAPPDTIYIFHYWQTFMDTIQNCTNYTIKNGRRVGCLISRDLFNAYKDLNIQVSGSSFTTKIKPFFYKLESYAFVKLQPPWLKNVSKTREGIYVNWEIPEHWKKQCLLYEVRVKSSKTSSWNYYSSKDQEKNITDADLNSNNSIQVRVQYTTTCGKSELWSEWSEVRYIGEDTKEWNWNIALLIFIPVLVAVIAIICLTNLKKLKKWILPPIPDPGKLLRGVFGDSNGDNTLHRTTNALKRKFFTQPDNYMAL